jgi:hypothetical protein
MTTATTTLILAVVRAFAIGVLSAVCLVYGAKTTRKTSDLLIFIMAVTALVLVIRKMLI